MNSSLEAELLGIQQEVRKQTMHSVEPTRCISVAIDIDDIGARIGRLSGEPLAVCTCDWQARVETEVARRWAASIEAAAAHSSDIETKLATKAAMAAAHQRDPK